MRFRCIEAHHSAYPVRVLREVLEVSPTAIGWLQVPIQAQAGRVPHAEPADQAANIVRPGQ